MLCCNSFITTGLTMGIVNQQSVREEVDRIKTEFNRLAANKKINSEIMMFIQSMLMLIELLVAIFLEKTTKKNNKNSSKPSSQTDKDESSTPNPGTHSKGKLETFQTANNTRTVESITIAKAMICDICGSDLSKIPCEHIERRNRIQKMVTSIIGEVIAQATLLKFTLRLHEALVAWEAKAMEQLLKMPAVHVDETSLRVDKKNQWMHIYSGEGITLKCLHPKRGTEAIESINIILRYSGTIIHDCLASYLSYEHCDHGLCGSHLLRELTFIKVD
jgi:transposase